MYKIIQRVSIVEEKEYDVYGIYYNDEYSISDISSNRETVEKMVTLFNKEKLEPCHLYDVVSDMLE